MHPKVFEPFSHLIRRCQIRNFPAPRCMQHNLRFLIAKAVAVRFWRMERWMLGWGRGRLLAKVFEGLHGWFVWLKSAAPGPSQLPATASGHKSTVKCYLQLLHIPQSTPYSLCLCLILPSLLFPSLPLSFSFPTAKLCLLLLA